MYITLFTVIGHIGGAGPLPRGPTAPPPAAPPGGPRPPPPQCDQYAKNTVNYICIYSGFILFSCLFRVYLTILLQHCYNFVTIVGPAGNVRFQ